ncbi:MAG TPA: heme ABC exporter ATP-binding protein CcmA [Firmicutes bacterium]|nr:heme ABC exporter ATP-binding protein CcmA [Bacillota bacterium]
MAKDVLTVKHLKKELGHKQVLKDVSFQAEPGELVVITGPNGAGKTTLLRILAGLTPKSGGEVLWKGGRIGYVAHQPMLYPNLSVQENLAFFGEMYGAPSQGRFQELLELVGLWFYRLEKAANLSRGMQQRLAIARALMAEPALLLYDEPFTSLDAGGREVLREVITACREVTIQLAITHELQNFAGLGYRELRLEDGRIVEGGGSSA